MPVASMPLVDVAKREGATPRKALALKRHWRAGRQKDSEEARKLGEGKPAYESRPGMAFGEDRGAPSETARAGRERGTRWSRKLDADKTLSARTS